MIGLQELVSSVYGAFRLAMWRPDGMAYFTVTAQGFWHSFFAAVVVAPGYLFVNAIGTQPAVESANPIHDGIIYVLAYVISWIAFPLAMVPVSELLEREDRYIPYVVANNWATVPQMALLMAVAIIRTGLGFGEVLSALFGLVAYGAILVYTWFVARTALNVPGFAAVGVVALSVAINLIVAVVADSFTTITVQ